MLAPLGGRGAPHRPVLLTESMEFLAPERGGLFVDCTLGLGGHAKAMLEAGAARVIGIDRDSDALAHARVTLAPWAEKVELVHSDYRAISSVLHGLNLPQV